MSIICMQAQNLKVCSIDDEVVAKFKKLRFNKSKKNIAIVSKLQITEDVE